MSCSGGCGAGSAIAAVPVGGGAAVFCVSALSIPAGVTLDFAPGTTPALVILSASSATIDGTVDLAGAPGLMGEGAVYPGTGGAGGGAGGPTGANPGLPGAGSGAGGGGAGGGGGGGGRIRINAMSGASCAAATPAASCATGALRTTP